MEVETAFSIKQANWCLFFVLLGYMVTDLVQSFLLIFFGIRPDMDMSIYIRMAAILPAVIFAFSSGKRRRSLRFSETAPANIVYSVLLAFFIYLLSSVVLTYLAELIVNAGGNIPENEMIDYLMSGSALTAFLFFSVFAPFTEEVMFRGVFQNAYSRRVGFFAVVLTGAIFGLMHGDLLSSINGVLAGIIICYIYYKTGSIWNTIAFHAVFNLLGYTLAADAYVLNLPWTLGLLPAETADTVNPAYYVYVWGIAVISALMIYVFIKLLARKNDRPAIYPAVPAKRQAFEMVPFILASLLLTLRLVLGTLAYFMN
jgi:membrane protease YdiL (CAAX protease family)